MSRLTMSFRSSTMMMTIVLHLTALVSLTTASHRPNEFKVCILVVKSSSEFCIFLYLVHFWSLIARDRWVFAQI